MKRHKAPEHTLDAVLTRHTAPQTPTQHYSIILRGLPTLEQKMRGWLPPFTTPEA